jgi:hypothetical protein
MSPAGMPYSTVLFRPASPLRWSLQWRQLWPLLDADADRVDLESRLIKLLLEDRACIRAYAPPHAVLLLAKGRRRDVGSNVSRRPQPTGHPG